MPLTRPIEYEPLSSDERTEEAVFRARQRRGRITPAGRTVSNGWSASMAGGKVGGAVSLKGGNPGPIGSPMAGSTDGSPVVTTFD